MLMAKMKSGFTPAPVGTITAPQEAFSGPLPIVQPLQQLDPLDYMPPAAAEKLNRFARLWKVVRLVALAVAFPASSPLRRHPVIERKLLI
jgi:hypothetical protein